MKEVDILNRTIQFLEKRIELNSQYQERAKYTAYYRLALMFTEKEIPKEVIAGSLYYPYRCPVCGSTVEYSWKYCCECGNRISFE